MITDQPCLCGSQQTYAKCCSDFHQEIKSPDTAEQLMRSRYSAYAQNNMHYIENTMMGKALSGFSLDKATRSAAFTQWLGLEVINSYLDKNNPNHAFVEFRALYAHAGKHIVMHELSEFKRVDGKWFYIDGQMQKSSRNDPCPCHSGKKFKKCHATKE